MQENIPFGPRTSPQWHENIDVDIVGALSMVANSLDELKDSGTVDAKLLRAVGQLQEAIRDIAIYVGVDYS